MVWELVALVYLCWRFFIEMVVETLFGINPNRGTSPVIIPLHPQHALIIERRVCASAPDMVYFSVFVAHRRFQNSAVMQVDIIGIVFRHSPHHGT